jgi:hypothetical protein
MPWCSWNYRRLLLNRSEVALVYPADGIAKLLRLHAADPFDQQQFLMGSGTLLRKGPQRLIAEHAKGGHSIFFRFRETPRSQLLFHRSCGW